MGAFSKVSGTWRTMTAPYVKVAGNWNIAKSAWAKLDDKWQSWFLQGGVLDRALGGEDEFTPNFTTNTGTAANDAVYSIALQSDGKILVGGEFTTFNGTTVNRIVRLNSDGTRDTAFTTNTGTAAAGTIDDRFVYSIAVQSDGKILVGGQFETWNGTTGRRIVRLNSDGTRDTAFTTNTGTAANNTVWSIALQSDGKILVGGEFTTWNGTTVNYIVRLNSDGTRDTAFTTNTGTAANNTVYSIAVQSDGKILVGGAFTTWNGTTVNRIVRLNSDGTRDTAFTTNTGTAASSTVRSVAVQSDGKILVGGEFSTFNGTTVNRIVRLNSDGTRDTAFTTNTGTAASTFVYSIALQSDGKILVGGEFSTFNGTTVNRIVLLNAEGTSLPTPGANNTVFSIAVQSDGKILVGGEFTTFNGTTVNYMVRLNSGGTRDTAFTTNTGTAANNTVWSIALQSDGKILLGGDFTIWNGTTVNRIVRLNSDGTRDTAFTTNTGTAASSTVRSIAIQSDGKILLGGSFITWNGTTVTRIVRLNSDGTRDTAFTTNTGTAASSTVNSIAVQSDGKILVGGEFTTWNGTTVNYIVRLNADGTRDTAFTTNTGTGAGSIVYSIAVQSDGKILLGGLFTTFNGTTVNRIVRLNSDGTRDTAFTTNTGTAANNNVFSIAVQSDGKVLIGGAFTTFNDVLRFRFTRIGGALAQ